MLTLEFKVSKISKEQLLLLDQWREGLRRLWNDGLGEFVEHEKFCVFRDSFQWEDDDIPFHWQYRWMKAVATESFQVYQPTCGFKTIEVKKDEWFPVFYSVINSPNTKRSLPSYPHGYSCPRPDNKRSWLKFAKRSTFRKIKDMGFAENTAYSSDNKPSYNSLTTNGLILNLDKYKFISSVFRNGLIKDLCEAWDKYAKDVKNKTISKKNKRGRPKFKKINEKVETLKSTSNGGVKVNKRWLYIPVLGWLKLHTDFTERWDSTWKINQFQIVEEASTLYIHLTSEDIQKEFIPTGTGQVGIDVGIKYHYADSDGECVTPPQFLRKSEKQLKRLQKRLSRQDRTKNRYHITRKRLARLHAKIARQRKAFNHYYSTKLVRENEVVVFEDLPIKVFTKRFDPQPTEDGKGFKQTGQSRRSGLAKSFLDAGLGQFRDMTEAKAKATGRAFIKVPPHYTSQRCSNCNEIVKKSLSQRTHRCPHCGYIDDRDVNAAKNILNLGLDMLGLEHKKKSTRLASGNFRR